MGEAITLRARQLAPKYESLDPVPQEDPIPVPPELPDGEGHDFRYRGYGADLALEVCRNSLKEHDEGVNGNVVVVMRGSQGVAIAKALTMAGDMGLFPWPAVNSA